MATLLFFLASAFPATLACQQPTPVRDADARCATCHASIVQNYLRTPMGNASGIASEQLHPGTYTLAKPGTTYDIAVKDQVPYLESHQPAPSHETWEAKLAYFLGSGHLGTTYLYWNKNYLFESPIAWYSRSQSLDMKPGLAEADFPVTGLPMQSACLRCHMSAVAPSDAGTTNRYSALPFLQTGITCETCHGDADHHVRSKGKSPMVNPARLDPWLRDSVCLSCHLEGDVTVERAGRSALNYRPGEPISDYLAFYVWKDAKATARGVSEVEQLSQSQCKRMAGDRMSCTTCHDPHSSPGPNERVAFFRAKCLTCHTQPEFKTHHAENPDCTSCHMPGNGAQNIEHVAWTDHRILRQPDTAIRGTGNAASGELVPVFSPKAGARDLAMANYQALLDGKFSLQPLAWQQLSVLRTEAGKDKELLDAFATMAAMKGEGTQAEKAFREVLQIDPNDFTALSNLGVLLAKVGRLADSEAMLRKAFDRNEASAGLAMNLARVECSIGQGEAGRTALNTALDFNPHLRQLRDLARQMSVCGVPAQSK